MTEDSFEDLLKDIREGISRNQKYPTKEMLERFRNLTVDTVTTDAVNNPNVNNPNNPNSSKQADLIKIQKLKKVLKILI
jgi:hypothetical protein